MLEWLFLNSNANNNTLTNNSLVHNNKGGFTLSESTNNSLTENQARNNLGNGFYLYINTNFNTLVINRYEGNQCLGNREGDSKTIRITQWSKTSGSNLYIGVNYNYTFYFLTCKVFSIISHNLDSSLLIFTSK